VIVVRKTNSMPGDRPTTTAGRRKRLIGAGVALVSALSVAACGSGEAANSSSAPTKDLPDDVAKYLEPPTSVGTDESLSAQPPTGKTIAVLTCNISSCRSYLDAATEAADVLGWTVEPFLFDPTPEQVLSQMNAAIASHPDGIMINGQDSSVWNSAISAAEAAQIPIVSQGSTDVPGGPVIATGTSSDQWDTVSELVGKFIAADSDGDAKVLSYGLAPFKISMQIASGIADAVTANCDGCTATVVPSQATDIGSGIPQDVVSQLQQNPDINYVSFSDGAMTPGVVAALREAGLSDKVKIVGADAQGTDYTSMKNGEEYAFVQFSVPSYAWQGVDALARHVVGDPQVTYTMPNQILTKSTIGDESADAVLNDLPRDLSDQWAKLWQVA
jgi:ribose transport system substrate-binding protein